MRHVAVGIWGDASHGDACPERPSALASRREQGKGALVVDAAKKAAFVHCLHPSDNAPKQATAALTVGVGGWGEGGGCSACWLCYGVLRARVGN